MIQINYLYDQGCDLYHYFAYIFYAHYCVVSYCEWTAELVDVMTGDPWLLVRAKRVIEISFMEFVLRPSGCLPRTLL